MVEGILISVIAALVAVIEWLTAPAGSKAAFMCTLHKP